MECKQLLFDDFRHILTGKTEWLEPNISHSYSDIYQYKLFTENHNDVGSSMGFGIGRAIIGGALLGPVSGALLGLTKKNITITSYTTCTIAISFKQGESISVTTTFDIAMDYMKALDHAYQLANSDDDDDDDYEIEYDAIPQITEKSTKTETPDPFMMRKPITVNSGADADALIKRAFSFLEDGDWERADVYSDYALDLELERADAYLVKLMVERKVNFKNELSQQDTPLEESPYYQKALKYADAEFASWLQECNKEIKCAPIYKEAYTLLATANSISEVENVQKLFRSIAGYKDVHLKLEKCKKKIEEFQEQEHKTTYNKAATLWDAAIYNRDIEKLQKVQNLLQTIPNYKDVPDKIKRCEEELGKINEELYTSAINEMKNAKTETEYNAIGRKFEFLADYKDSSSYYQGCLEKAEEINQEKQIKQRRRRILLSLLIIEIIIASGILIIRYVNSQEYLESKAQRYIADMGGYYQAWLVYEQIKSDNLKQEVSILITKEAISDENYDVALDTCKEITDAAIKQEVITSFAKKAVVSDKALAAWSLMANNSIKQELLFQITKEAISVNSFEFSLWACSQIKDDSIKQEFLSQIAKEAISVNNFEFSLRACSQMSDISIKRNFCIKIVKCVSSRSYIDAGIYLLYETGMKIDDITQQTGQKRSVVESAINRNKYKHW